MTPFFVKRFVLALSFLSRLVPGRIVPSERLGLTLHYFPLAGLFLGVCAVLPFYLGLAAQYYWVQAFLFCGLSVYFTRGLHLDGLADVMDGWGSNARGEEFWRVLKDGCAGPFGVIGIFFALSGQIILSHEMFVECAFGTLVWSFILGRLSILGLAWAGRDMTRPGLGRAFISQADGPTFFKGFISALFFGIWLTPLTCLALSLIFSVLGQIALFRLARTRGGMNGDFLGASVIFGELSAPLAWVLL